MSQIKEKLLLHPVRLRILLAVAGRQVTAQQLAYELKDIPQATLYRNINTLAVVGALKVVRERRVHNRLEKTYAVPEEGVMLSPEDLKQAPPEVYIRLFTQYFGLFLNYFAKYLHQGDVDLQQDHVLFQMIPPRQSITSLGENSRNQVFDLYSPGLTPCETGTPQSDKCSSLQSPELLIEAFP